MTDRAVSYTHLHLGIAGNVDHILEIFDLQRLARGNDRLAGCQIFVELERRNVLGAVSYTHLDVYKRQVVTLLEADAENVALLDRLRLIVRVDLDNVVACLLYTSLPARVHRPCRSTTRSGRYCASVSRRCRTDRPRQSAVQCQIGRAHV